MRISASDGEKCAAVVCHGESVNRISIAGVYLRKPFDGSVQKVEILLLLFFFVKLKRIINNE